MGNETTNDALDWAIIAELEEDARLSNAELARRVGLTPAPCLRRVQRLERDGVITGYHARVDPRSSGRGLEVIVAVDIVVNDGPTFLDFEDAEIGRASCRERAYHPLVAVSVIKARALSCALH